MRKTFAILAVVALIGATTSCKKDYTCTCTTKIPGSDDVVQALPMGKVTKGDAEKSCDALNVAGGSTTTCAL